MIPTFEEVFKIYNYIATIFRANIDEEDRAAHKVADKFQDNTVLGRNEEEYIRSFLTKDTNSITKPYSTSIGNMTYIIYLIDEKKIGDVGLKSMRIKVASIPQAFSNVNGKIIIVLNKDRFKMENLYDNEDDKKDALDFYTQLFRSVFQGINIPEWKYTHCTRLADILGLLFYYQATCGKITRKEYEKIKIRRPNDSEPDIVFDLMEDILKYGEMYSFNIPLINENPNIQQTIARIIWLNFSDEIIKEYTKAILGRTIINNN